jgi:hypothetical protein
VGGLFNFVMKSGTNQVHGSALFEFRNQDLDANTFLGNFNGTPRAIDRQLDGGGSFGGPVWIPKVYNGNGPPQRGTFRKDQKPPRSAGNRVSAQPA